MLEFFINSNFLTSSTDDKRKLITDACRNAAKDLEEIIKQEFEKSVAMGAMIGQYTDPEAIRAILRSVKVEVIEQWPPDLNIKFEDDLGHLYGAGELPEEFIKVIQDVYDSAITVWSLRNDFEQAIVDIVDS